VIDWSDPAAGHWLEHFALRVGECRKMADTIAQHRAIEGARVLDVGCQTGALSVVLGERGARVVGLDTAEWLVEAARRRAQGWGVAAEFVVGRGEALPFESASFDVVTFVDVIEHCQDAHRCLREIARVLRPGGVAYVLGPNRFAPEWLVSDPHYQLAGASVLPHALGKRYVEWRRGKPGYDVGVFPVGNLVGRTLRRAGLVLVDSPVHAAERWWKAHAPVRLQGLVPLARAWGAVRFAAIPTFVVVAKRPAREPGA
jgi:SAM-dependent methyltransferase